MSHKHKLISGLLNINKPQGMTSHDVVARIRKLSKQRKVGHTGTLDPMATGVLLVCLGQATRLIEYLMLTRKQYQATIRFGVVTDTLDAEGKVVSHHDTTSLTEARIREVLPTFMGEIEQVPPIFSALKQGGQPLYKRARAGEEIALDPRPVTLYNLDWIAWQPPDLTLAVTCSPGTYIRSLARDLGEALETGAHLAALARTANGPWLLEQAVSLETLEQENLSDELKWQTYLHPLDSTVTHLPKVILDETKTRYVKHGRQIHLSTKDVTLNEQTQLLRAYNSAGKFLAILKQVEAEKNIWQPKKVFN